MLARRTLIPLIVACALFMENLDSTVLSTALPAIATSLGESPVRLNLGISAYLFSLAVFIPISGWAADKFGARTVFRIAIVVFTFGSILCGFSQSLYQFVGARIFQGLGGAMMVPVGRLVLLRTVPKSELVSAMALVTVPALVGPVIGPVLGGLITTYVSWRWIFWINVPVGLLVFAGCYAVLRDPDYLVAQRAELRKQPFHFDSIGLSLLVIVMVCWEVMLSKGQEWDWLGDPFWRVQTLALLFVVGLVGLVW